MRRAYKSGAAAVAPGATQATSEGFPTEGDVANAVPATVPGPYWFHAVTEAIVTVVEQAGLEPADDPNQFRDAILALLGGYIPQGTRMVFHQAAAPTGWTKITDINDRLLRVVSSDGGGTGGNWEISGISVGGTELTIAHLPAHSHAAGTLAAVSDGAHTHSYTRVFTTAPFNGPIDNSGGDQYRNAGSNTGTAGDHTHSISGSTAETGEGSEHNHPISADANWRPAYADVIVCSKD